MARESVFHEGAERELSLLTQIPQLERNEARGGGRREREGRH